MATWWQNSKCDFKKDSVPICPLTTYRVNSYPAHRAHRAKLRRAWPRGQIFTAQYPSFRSIVFRHLCLEAYCTTTYFILPELWNSQLSIKLAWRKENAAFLRTYVVNPDYGQRQGRTAIETYSAQNYIWFLYITCVYNILPKIEKILNSFVLFVFR